jgi:hypothetical protein
MSILNLAFPCRSSAKIKHRRPNWDSFLFAPSGLGAPDAYRIFSVRILSRPDRPFVDKSIPFWDFLVAPVTSVTDFGLPLADNRHTGGRLEDRGDALTYGRRSAAPTQPLSGGRPQPTAQAVGDSEATTEPRWGERNKQCLILLGTSCCT